MVESLMTNIEKMEKLLPLLDRPEAREKTKSDINGALDYI